MLVAVWVIPATAQDFQFPLFPPGTVKNGNILGQDGIWRPVSEARQPMIAVSQTQPAAEPVKKNKAKEEKCRHGVDPNYPDECWNPWGKEKRPYPYYEHVGVKLSRGLGENEGITIYQK